MNLASIALMRAEEQSRSASWVEPTEKRKPKLTCACGTCPRCRKRGEIQRYRARVRSGEPGPKAPDPTRTCVLCRGDRGTVCASNATSVCTPCQRRMRVSVNTYLGRCGFSLDGGGI